MEKEKMDKALKDKDFVAKILAMQTPEEVQEAFKGKGVEISLEEVEILGKIINKTAEKGEMLSEEELKEISGGNLGEDILWGTIIVGCSIGGSFLDGVEEPNFSEGIKQVFNSDYDKYDFNDTLPAKMLFKAGALAYTAGSVVGKVKNGVKWAKRKITGKPKSSK